jgi:hypothetical protein
MFFGSGDDNVSKQILNGCQRMIDHLPRCLMGLPKIDETDSINRKAKGYSSNGNPIC